jgi:cell division protein FtsI (penicillin-binding protein 3)
MLYNAVANNGKMMKPYLVNSVRQYGVDIQTFQPAVVVDKICSDETLAQLKECMLAVVQSDEGTAHALMDSAYQIAGKTGTAVTALDNKGYNKDNKIYQAAFIGYFPAAAPKYTIAVVIQNGSHSKLIYGAAVAGTVFKEISDKIYGKYLSTTQFTTTTVDTSHYNYFGMKTDLNSIFTNMNIPFADSSASGYWRSSAMRNDRAVLSVPTNTTGTITPSVVGMGLKDAVYLLENMGMKVSVTGKGKVFNQSLTPGTPFTKDTPIALVLN